MPLSIADTDDAYLIAKNTKSRVAGYFYLSDLHNKFLIPTTQRNASVHVECNLLTHVVSSAAEAEIAGIFYHF